MLQWGGAIGWNFGQWDGGFEPWDKTSVSNEYLRRGDSEAYYLLVFLEAERETSLLSR